ncbi:MAG: hypothetical protein F6K47_12725 [Symploca sp. SIO2E6]|nr:hypothetical protein [Symploca sp. SIO2E6]
MKRYALVVGVSLYDQLPQLTKPKVDAEAVAQKLEKYGEFQEVKPLPSHWLSSEQCEVGQTRLTSRELIQELRYFLLEQAANSEALLYFSGHGIALFDDGQYIVSGSADQTVCLLYGSWQGWLQVCRDRLNSEKNKVEGRAQRA